MTSQSDFDRFVASQRGVRAKALRQLAKWWVTIADKDPDEIKAAAERFVPALAHTYGELSSLAAAQFYDDARSDSIASGRYVAVMSDSTAAATARAEMGWAWAALRDDPAVALDRLSGVVDAAALQDGRNTIVANSRRDPSHPSWARVPVGATCAWCLMLASRGAVYWTAEAAGSGKKFHRACDCQPVPSWDRGRGDLPAQYDQDRLYGLYRNARDLAGSGKTKDIVAAFRRLDGGVHVTDGVAA